MTRLWLLLPLLASSWGSTPQDWENEVEPHHPRPKPIDASTKAPEVKPTTEAAIEASEVEISDYEIPFDIYDYYNYYYDHHHESNYNDNVAHEPVDHEPAPNNKSVMGNLIIPPY